MGLDKLMLAFCRYTLAIHTRNTYTNLKPKQINFLLLICTNEKKRSEEGTYFEGVYIRKSNVQQISICNVECVNRKEEIFKEEFKYTEYFIL